MPKPIKLSDALKQIDKLERGNSKRDKKQYRASPMDYAKVIGMELRVPRNDAEAVSFAEAVSERIDEMKDRESSNLTDKDKKRDVKGVAATLKNNVSIAVVSLMDPERPKRLSDALAAEVAADAKAAEPKKPGLFSRLFGGKAKSLEAAASGKGLDDTMSIASSSSSVSLTGEEHDSSGPAILSESSRRQATPTVEVSGRDRSKAFVGGDLEAALDETKALVSALRKSGSEKPKRSVGFAEEIGVKEIDPEGLGERLPPAQSNDKRIIPEEIMETHIRAKMAHSNRKASANPQFAKDHTEEKTGLQPGGSRAAEVRAKRLAKAEKSGGGRE